MIAANRADRDDGAMTEFTAERLFLVAAADYRQDRSGIAGDRS
jgi:hypothetical protein